MSRFMPGPGIYVFTRRQAATVFLVELPFMRLFSNSMPVAHARDADLFFACNVDIKRFKCDVHTWRSPFDLHLRSDRYNPSNPSNGATRL